MINNPQNIDSNDNCGRKKQALWISIAVAVIIIIAAVLMILFFSGHANEGDETAEDIPASQAGENEEYEEGNEDQAEKSNDETDSGERVESIGDLEVVNAYINNELHIIKVLSDGSEIDIGVSDVGTDDSVAGTFTVTFLNYDGGVLKEQTVGRGGNVQPPAEPVREGFTFLGWKGTYDNVTEDSTVIAMFLTEGAEPDAYTVTFLDYDGTVIDTQTVTAGETASMPDAPEREGYEFCGWDTRFSPVFSDLTVTAQYVALVENADTVAIDVSNAKASAGETVQVQVSLKNNPGLLGMELKLMYDNANLTLIKAVNGSATTNMNLTRPGVFLSGCSFVWDNTDVVNGDGEILELTFQIADSAALGIYPIEIRCGDTPMVDENFDTIIPVVHSGKITVS